MMRSYLLCILTNPGMSITKWVKEMYHVPLYAILSGFKPEDIPGVGTFYDFFDRVWTSSQSNTYPNIKVKRHRYKSKKKLKKGQKLSIRKPGIVKRLIDRFFKLGSSKKERATDILFDIFDSIFISKSADLGILGDLEKLSIAGDGTPVVTSSLIRSKSICDCHSRGIYKCKCPRFYSQPDCNSGWDSSREKYFNGYDLYMLSACDSHYDLPLYPKLNPAARHDSIGLLSAFGEFSHRFNVGKVDKILLDAAHDSNSMYELFEHLGIEPFIDLNTRTKKTFDTKCDITISISGTPIGPCGHELASNGFDHSSNRRKWRCTPTRSKKLGCTSPCSDSKYGRTFHTYSKDNLRLFTKTPRDSIAWKNIYKRRTSVERSNKREKVDYQLESGKHRSSKMWYVRLYNIMMAQHIDAWYSELSEDYSNLKKIIFGQ